MSLYGRFHLAKITLFGARACAVGLVRIPFFELRSFSSNQHIIFEASEGGAEHFLLSNKGRNLCVSVCLFAFLCREAFIQSTSHVAGVLLGPKGVQCRILVQYGHATHSELINYRAARAGSGTPHAGRAYMLRERTLH